MQPLFADLRNLTPRPTDTAETLAIAAVSAAILVLSTSGNTARLVSKYRPEVPILTVTRNEQTARQIHLHRGCYPFHVSLFSSLDRDYMCVSES
jgi:pyruvate kinase